LSFIVFWSPEARQVSVVTTGRGVSVGSGGTTPAVVVGGGGVAVCDCPAHPVARPKARRTMSIDFEFKTWLLMKLKMGIRSYSNSNYYTIRNV
jgi:uncharacterized membrane protein YraQ (UPF0718 family)